MFETWGKDFVEFASTGEFLITEVANQLFQRGSVTGVIQVPISEKARFPSKNIVCIDFGLGI